MQQSNTHSSESEKITPEGKQVNIPLIHFDRTMIYVYELKRIKSEMNLILLYIYLILVFIGIQLGLLATNFVEQEFIEENYFAPFHFLEFWAVFTFTLLESFIWMIVDSQAKQRNKIQMGLTTFNVTLALVAAIVFSMYPPLYETYAHFLEYLLQLFIVLVDFIFIFRRRNTKYRILKIALVACTFLASMLQILYYTSVIPTSMGPERSAHFCEYSIEIVNGSFAMWFGYEMYFEEEEKLSEYYKAINEEAEDRKLQGKYRCI